MEIQEILQSKDKGQVLALFKFKVSEPDRNILMKFNLWGRFFYPRYFECKDAPFHELIDLHNLQAYTGELKSFTDIAFRGGAKTTRTKLFLAYAIANDKEHWRKHIKVLSKDIGNSKQIVTDIYNLFVEPKFTDYYPEMFKKTDSKREETMLSFTTAAGTKLRGGTVGTDQRGQLQDTSRPDLILFEDFETRKTLRSAVETHAIWENMEEARTGLSKNGACIYNCNYVSERGNVHKLVQKESPLNRVLIVPIIKDGTIAWDRYSQADIGQIKLDADDFSGEYLCQPSASFEIMFDRELLDAQIKKEPIEVSASFKIYHEFDASHRYASGHDIAGGVGLDSSTSVFIDFETLPARVVGTFKSNAIAPDVFADEIQRQTEFFGGNLVAPEKNNHGHATISRLKQLGCNIFKTQGKVTKLMISAPTEYGWHTNVSTKPKMIFDLIKAVDNGQLSLGDIDLISECRSYARDDMMDKEIDPRLATRHFDLLIACAIAWQMKDFAKHRTSKVTYKKPLPQQISNPAL